MITGQCIPCYSGSDLREGNPLWRGSGIHVTRPENPFQRGRGIGKLSPRKAFPDAVGQTKRVIPDAMIPTEQGPQSNAGSIPARATFPKKRDMVPAGASVVYSEGCRSRRTRVVSRRIEQQGYADFCEYQTGPFFQPVDNLGQFGHGRAVDVPNLSAASFQERGWKSFLEAVRPVPGVFVMLPRRLSALYGGISLPLPRAIHGRQRHL